MGSLEVPLVLPPALQPPPSPEVRSQAVTLLERISALYVASKGKFLLSHGNNAFKSRRAISTLR